jgi:hypothetical protein
MSFRGLRFCVTLGGMDGDAPQLARVQRGSTSAQDWTEAIALLCGVPVFDVKVDVSPDSLTFRVPSSCAAVLDAQLFANRHAPAGVAIRVERETVTDHTLRGRDEVPHGRVRRFG